MIPIILISTVIGIIVGITGFGDGILLFPALIHYGIPPKQAVAVSLVLNSIPNTIPALWMYYKNKHINIKLTAIITITTLIGISVGAYFGSGDKIPDKYIYRIYTITLFSISIYMFRHYW
jgi:uncharacterized membrane protein YfcA